MPELVISDFSGMDLRSNYLIADGALQLMQNCRVQQGVIYRGPGWQEQTTVALGGNVQWVDWFRKSTGAVLITFTAATVYSGGTFSSISGTPLTGTTTDKFQAASFNDVYYFTNGVDQVQKYTGSGNHAAIGGSPQFTKAKALSSSQDRLIVANTTEAGTNYPNRIRWSKTGNGDNWTDQTAGFLDLIASSDQIIALYPLRDQLIVFTRSSIWRVFKVGFPLMFDFQLITDTVTLWNTNAGGYAVLSIVPVQNNIYFFGQDNVYRFDGFSFQKIGDPIWQWFYLNTNLTSTAHSLTGGTDWAKRCIYWNIQTTKTAAYNWEENHWEVPFDNDQLVVARTPLGQSTYAGVNTGNVNRVVSINDTPGARAVAAQTGGFTMRFRSKVFGHPGAQVLRITRISFGIRTKDASLSYQVKVTGYDDLDILNFPTPDTGISANGSSNSDTKTLNIAKTSAPYLDFDVFGRWFDVQVTDSSGTGTQTIPAQLFSSMVIHYEEIGENN